MSQAIPMKTSVKYPEQINVKVEIDTKFKLQRLKERGADVAEICRQAIKQAIEEANETLSVT